MAWQEKILRVDLEAGTCVGEPLNMEWASRYLGQRGLASKYLMEEMDPRVDALSPANKLIFATGPLTGTPAPTGGRYSVVTKGALTGAIACSNSGGRFGAELKNAGWDMIIVEGRAAKPVYLYIEDDRARILDAEDFIWGRSVWETEDAIVARHGDPLARIASIGRAGEVGVRYACVMNDRDRAAGRSGVGAVMGSKNLKAIAVRGTVGVRPRDGAAFAKAVADAYAAVETSPSRKRLASHGTMPMMDVTNAFGSLPTRNGREVQFEGIDDINAKAMRRPRASDGQANVVGNKACFACTIGCGQMAKMDGGHFAIKDKTGYGKVEGGLEYESGFALGPMVGCSDLEAATYVNYICNEHSMDPISFGGTAAAAMELFAEGAITTADSEGMALQFGSAEALVWMVDKAAGGEGFGADLGLGAKRLCEKYGRPELAMVVKGQEFPGYDTRAMQGMGLAYATSNRGACHLRANTFEADFDSTAWEGKAKVAKDSQDVGAAVDSLGLCAFVKGTVSMAQFAAMVDAACPGGWDEERLVETGERVWNIERQFNLAAGFTRADDTLPERMLKVPAPSGAGKGQVTRLDKMLPEYYALRGWDENGVPGNEILARLGM